ncbi:ATP-binding cassette domain-containing protein [Microbacterium aureliae]
MTLRPAPLRAAATLAAAFVAVRVVYRVVFHGADGTGPVLWDLPAVRLPDPFGHVVLLGRATLDGVTDAVSGALPIALTILAFGLLNALVDLPRLLARGGRRGPLRGIARTLAVAWATLPALAAAVRAVRRAQRLRGGRGGVRMLTPILERTLERATALAAALELRGLGGTGADGACEAPVVARGVVLRHRGAASGLVVADVALDPGTLTVVTGPTGGGKTTLLRALAGLHGHLDAGDARGDLDVVGHDRATLPPRDTARLVGVVLQNPRDGFATPRVRDEIGLALELRGVAEVIVRARVSEVAARVGITELLDREIAGLSAGEATLVAIAAAVSEHPILLLVDEPLADLDPAMRTRIIDLLDTLAHGAGVCVVVAEHRVAGLAAVADRRLEVADGRVTTAAPDEAGPDAGTQDAGAADAAPAAAPDATPAPPVREVLRVHELTVTHGARIAVDRATLSVAAGEVVAVVGPNGAGKSSLLDRLALPRRRDDVVVDGEQATPSRTARGRTGRRVALVPDSSDDLFVCDTVAAECARTDRRHRLPRGTTAARWAALVDRDGLGEAGMRHPRDLSAGERRCLALAVQLAGSPRVLMVDEPTRGLDPRARALVASAVRRLAGDGVAVLLATHDRDFAAAVDARILPMAGGALHRARTQSARGPQPAGGLRTSLGTENGHASPAAAPPPRATPPRPRPGRIAAAFGHGFSVPARIAAVPALAAANLVAVAAFAWPLVAAAVPAQAQAAVPAASLALAPLAALVVLAALDGSVRSAHTLALLGTLAAIGAAIRIVGTGVGGVEAVFILLILAGRAFGARFGLLLGLLTIALSSLVWGGIGPWTPFQMFACAWVAAGAGLLPRRVRGLAEVVLLAGYGVAASFAFGLVMNLWFWPFAVGGGTAISYEAGAPLAQNLGSFLVYSLVTSSASWDALRAVTTVVGIAVVGRSVLAALRRATPATPLAGPSARRASPRTPADVSSLTG